MAFFNILNMHSTFSKSALAVLHFRCFSFFFSKLLLCFQTEGEKMPSEAYFMKKIQHPNAMKLYQYLSLNDFYIYIMERPASCQELQRVLQKRRLTEKEARQYFKQIIEAIICCQENGVIHRDFKPENILLDMETDEISLDSKLQYESHNKFRSQGGVLSLSQYLRLIE